MSGLRFMITVGNNNYYVSSHFLEDEQLVYRNFMITKETKPFFLYQLGVTRMALKIYNYKHSFDPAKWLYELGSSIVQKILQENDFSKDSGLITSLEMSNQKYDWRKLQNIDLTKHYSQ